MKKIMLTAIIAVIAMVSVNAQEGVFRVGGSVGYSSEFEEIGFGADAVYSIDETWEVAANYYLISEFDLSFLNANAHYLFSESFYALGGLGIAKYKGGDGSETGANLGLGGRFGLSDNISFFTEAKYNTMIDGFMNIRAGILFSF